MGRPSADECSTLIFDGASPVGDADISGIGVILAFILSAYITLAVVVAAYATGQIEGEMLNLADTRIFRVRPYRGNKPAVHAAIRKAVLALSDQQIVTGIAIMGAGFQGLRTGSISVYHFQIVLYLAWMSSSVHLSALTLLRPFLMDHLGVKAWRLCGMLVLLVLLVIGIIPTISNDWGVMDAYGQNQAENKTNWAIPASCFWGRTYGDGVNADAILGWVILFFSYVWKVGDLFTSVREWFLAHVPEPLDRGVQATLLFAARRYENHRKRRWLWLFRALLIFYLPITAVFEIAASFSASMWVATLGLIFGTIQIVVPRNQNIDLTGSQENSWGFGQLTPLILLIQPLGAVTEVFWVRNRRESVVEFDDADWDIPRRAGHDTPGRENEDPTKAPFSRFILTLTQTRADELSGNAGAAAMDSARESHSKELQHYLYSSLLFKAHIIITHIGIALIAALVVYNDVLSIGNWSPGSWVYVASGMAGYLAFVTLVTILWLPFSRLGRPVRWGNSDSDAQHWPMTSLEMRVPRFLGRSRDDDDETTSPLRKDRTDTSYTSRTGTSSST